MANKKSNDSDDGEENEEVVEEGKVTKIVPDTSAIIERVLADKIINKEIEVGEVLMPEAAFAELVHLANEGKSIGWIGLDEIKALKQLDTDGMISLKFIGTRPTAADIKYAGLGEIDSRILNIAWEEGATLVTGDKVQAKAAEAKGVNVILIRKERAEEPIKLESFFDAKTMSVHLKESVLPYAKKGMPGDWQFVALSEKKLKQDDIKNISGEIIEETSMRDDGFIEIERTGSSIIQLGRYRITITRPPFSDGWEITAVRPVKQLTLKEYELSEKLMQRISEQAEGILIAGAPGMGKSTFAQALAEHYADQDKIVKTIEAPRDLVLPENVTQYAISHGDSQEIHDILLLSRPDNTVFDEMRNTEDFKLFADLRLAGIGLAGVVHATNPIDAIQRFVGRIELGVIPQVIDTVIFIKNGTVDKVLSLQMVVKVPAGMTEADLARPIVVIADFETKKTEFELYSYGEETVVVPVKGDEGMNPSHKLAAEKIREYFGRYSDEVSVDVVSGHKAIVKVPEREIPRIIGKQGSNIEKIEEALGMNIDIQEFGGGSEGRESDGGSIPFQSQITKTAIQLILDVSMKAKDVDIYVDGDYLLSAKAGKSGVIRIRKNNKIGKFLVEALNTGDNVEVRGT